MKRFLSLILCASVLTGCGSDGGSDDNDALVGYLTFHGIRGLSYETQSQSGTTGIRGEFYYRPGETLTFRLGNIVLARDVPAKERLSPLDLVPENQEELYQGVMVDGLSTHKPVETALVESDTYLINVYRLLLALDADENEKNGIYIRDEILEEIVAYPMEEPINFHKNPADFGNLDVITAPENLFVWALCFTDVWSDRNCTNPFDGRKIKTDNVAKAYMQEQLDKISGLTSTDFRLEPYAVEIASGDRSLHTVTIKSHSNTRTVAELEVLSGDDSVVAIHNYDPSTQQVTFYNTASEQLAETVLTINIRPTGDYRWIRKNLSVRIHPNPGSR